MIWCHQSMMYMYAVTLDISKSKFIPNYRYFKVYFPIHKNYFKISVVQAKRFCNENKNRKCVQTVLFDIRGCSEMSEFEIARIDSIYLYVI